MSAPTLFDPERPAATTAAGPSRPLLFVIPLPKGLRLMNANQRLHYRRRAEYTEAIRSAAMEAVSDCPALMAALAAAKPGPLFQRAHVLGILHRRQRHLAGDGARRGIGDRGGASVPALEDAAGGPVGDGARHAVSSRRSVPPILEGRD